MNKNGIVSTFEQLENRTLLTANISDVAGSDIAYDKNGNLNIAFFDASSHSLKFQTQSAATKTLSAPVTVDNINASDLSNEIATAIDPSGNAGIAYYDQGNGALKYAHFNGTNWTVTTVDSKSNAGLRPSLAYDKKGKAIITYFQKDTMDLKYAEQSSATSTKFSKLTITKNAQDVIASAVAVNPANNQKVIAYQNKLGQIRYTVKGSSGFSSPILVDNISQIGTGISIAFDANGNPVFSYYDPTSGVIKLATKTGKTFSVEPVATVPAGVDPQATVLIANGKTNIVYYNSQSDGLFVASEGTSGNFDSTQLTIGGKGSQAVLNADGSIGYAIYNAQSETLTLASTTTTPAVPSNVTAVAKSTSEIDLSWTDNSNNEVSFQIDRSTDGTNFSTIGTAAANSTSYNDTTAAEGTTYFYHVYAVGSDGSTTLGTIANGAGANNAAIATTFPAGATNLSGVQTVTTVTLSWTDNSHGETGYRVERSSNGGTSFTLLSNLPANSTGFVDSNLTEGTAYTYRVTAFNSTGDGAAITKSVTTLPAAPTALNATPASPTQVNLTWTDNSSHETGYIVERNVNGGGFTTIATLGANTTTYSDTSAPDGASIVYRVHAVLGSLNSANATALAVTTALIAPTNLSANGNGTNEVDLTWSDNTSNATGYNILRKGPGDETYIIIGSAAADATAYTDTTVTEGNGYSYEVQAFNEISTSAVSTPAAAATTALNQPTNLQATVISQTEIDLTWTDNSSNESEYQVFRSTNGGLFGVVAELLGSNVQNFHDTSVTEGNQYSYQVKAANGTPSDSLHSNTATATTPLFAPSDLAVTDFSTSSVSLSWTNNSTNNTGYNIFVTDNGAQWDNAVVINSASTTSTTIAGLADGHTYTFAIKAVNAISDSAHSSTVTQITPLIAPSGLQVTDFGTNEVDLSWTNNSTNNTGYQIFRKVNGAQDAHPIIIDGADTTTYADTNLQDGFNYTYEIKAVNDVADSAHDGPVSQTTTLKAATGLQVTGTGTNEVDLSWTNNTNNATSIQIWRSHDGGSSYKQIDEIDPTSTSYQDTGVDDGQTYVYFVRAVNDNTSSDSGTVNAATPLIAPTNFQVTGTTTDTVSLSWTNNTSNAKGYLLLRSDDGGLTYTSSFALPASTTSYNDTSSLQDGTVYKYELVAQGFETGTDSAVVGPIAATTLLNTPTGLQANAVSPFEIDLTWANNTSNATSYQVWRSPEGGNNYQKIADLAGNATSYHDQGVNEGTYYIYYVVAANDNTSSQSSTAFAVTQLVAPTNFQVTSATAGEVDLSWTDNSNNEVGYRVYRSDTGVQNTFVQVGSDLAAGTQSFQDTTVTEGHTYYYEVNVFDGTVETGGPIISAQLPPAAPSNLQATANASNSVALTWTDNSNTEDGYLVYRDAHDGNGFQLLTGQPANSTGMTDTTTFEGGDYSYTVVATLGALRSDQAPSSEVTTPPNTPSSVSVQSDENDLTINWKDNSNIEDSYVIQRSDDGGTTWNNPVALNPDTQSFNDIGLTEGTHYVYRIAASLNGQLSPYLTTDAFTLPTGPDTLQLTAVSANEIDVQWDDNSNGETGYAVTRTDNIGGDEVATLLDAGTTSFKDTTVAGGVSYTYTVSAFNDGGSSTEFVQGSQLTVPDGITDLSADVVSATEVDLSWSAPANGVDHYRVERSADGGSTFTDAVFDNINTNSFADTTTNESSAYVYRVFAVNATGDSAESNHASVFTLPATPTNVVATGLSTSQMDITWSEPSATATKYRLERSADGSTGWTSVGTLDTPDNEIIDIHLSAGTTYFYRVIAIAGGVESAPSAVISGITIPAAPTNVLFEATSDSQILFSSDRVTGADTYTLQTLTGGNWVNIDTESLPDLEANGLTEETTASYRIFASNSSGDSAPSGSVSVTTLPAAPSNLQATPVDTGEIDLTWDNNSSVATGIFVGFVDDNGDFVSVSAELPANTTSYNVTGLNEGTDYDLAVIAQDDNQPLDSAITDVMANTPPAAPSNVQLSLANPTSTNTVEISWTNNSNGQDGFDIFRSDVDDTNFQFVAHVDATTTSYEDTGATEGTDEFYYVAATKEGIETGSVENDIVTAPATPTNLAATATGPNEIDLTWDDNSNNEVDYVVERSVGDDQNFSFYDFANGGSYNDTSAPDGKDVFYRVYAEGAGSANSDYSNEDDAITPLIAPTNLVATANSDTSVTLTWDANSLGDDGYQVEREDNGSGTFNPVGEVTAAHADTFTDTTVTENNTYTYRVYATGDITTSDFSNTFDVTTPLAAPSDLQATSPNSGEIDLTWTNNSAFTTSITVERSEDGGQHWDAPVTLAADATSYNDIGLNEATSYSYRVTAVGNTNQSIGTTIDTQTIPDAPDSLNATTFSSSEIDLTWNDNSINADDDVVGVSTDGGNTFNFATVPLGTGSLNATGLTEGTDYEFEVFSEYNGQPSDAIIAFATTKPATPDSLSSTSITDSSVSLTWNDNSNGELEYVIERDSGGGFGFYDSVPANTTTYTDSNVSEGTSYSYRVYALGNGAVASDFSNTLNVLTLPASPDGFTATATSTNRVVLSWNDNSNGEDGYTIERADGDSGNFQPLHTTLANVDTYSDNTVSEGSSYTYRLTAFDGTGNSLSSPTASASTVPLAPTGFAIADNGPQEIDLSWTNNSTHANYVSIERSSNGGVSYTEIDQADPTSTSFADTTVAEGKTYKYRIRAIGDTGDSTYTPALGATTTLFDPTNVTATAASSTQINLTWTDNSGAETGYQIYRDNVLIKTTAANVTSYADTGLNEGTTYDYKIKAIKGVTSASNAVDTTGTTLPADPTGMTATVASDTEIDLTWNDNSNGETDYLVQVSTDNGQTWSEPISIGANSTGTNFTGLNEGSAYQFRVYAVDDGGSSGFSTSANVTTLPTAPDGLQANPLAVDDMQLTWNDNSGHETAFLIERNDGTGWTQIGSVGPNVTSYDDTTITEATEYQYRVRATQSGLNSAYSNVVDLISAPATPSNVVAASITDSKVTVTWADNSNGEDGYTIERSDDGGITFNFVGSVGSNTATFDDTTVTEGTYYQYRVYATVSGAQSAFSDVAEVTVIPAAPTGLNADTVDTVNGFAQISWTDNSNGEDGFHLYRQVDGTGYSLYDTIGPDSQVYIDGDIASGHVYDYILVAFTSGGESAHATLTIDTTI